MLIEEIIEKLDEGGFRSYFGFATFITHLLKFHLEKQGKELVTDLPRDLMGDAFCPAGMDNIAGPVLIEIKFFISRSSMPVMVEVLTASAMRLANNNDGTLTVIVISGKNLSTYSRQLWHSAVARISAPVKFILWEPREINKIVTAHKAKAVEIVRNLFSLRLETVASKPKIDWKELRGQTIERLSGLYRNGQFSLFLGAGVSSSAGMPDWNKLLNSLFVSYLAQELDREDAISDSAIDELVTRLNAVDEPSTLMAARYLREGFARPGADKKAFVKAITKALYGLRNQNIESPLIKAIAALCVPRRTGARVRSVITYNFDDLLERQLDESSIFHKCIYTKNETYDPDELPVYHVHGFTPEDATGYEDLDGSTLVFSEEGYHQIYSDPYHWSNLVQLNSFRENHCLMIGLSMTDPNLRRLLDIAARNTDLEQSKHFAFMKRLSEERFCYEEDQKTGERKAVIGDVESAKEFLERHHLLNEELMKELGVTVIWYEHYDEIPQMLRKIVEA